MAFNIYKYSTFEDAQKSQWVFNPDTSYYSSIRKLFNIANELNAVKYPKGIFLYKTFEQANEQRRQWEMDHALKKIRKYEK